MSNVNGGTITVRIEGKDVGLSDLLTKINTQMAASGQNARNYASQMASISPSTARTEQALAKYVTTLAGVAAAQGDTAGSQKLLISGLQQLTPATSAANGVLLTLQKSLNAEALATEKAAQALAKLNAEKLKTPPPVPQTADPATSQLVSLGKLVTAYHVASAVAREFAETLSAGNELEKTLTTFRVLSGSQEQYTKNLQLAKEQQSQFGGSLNDTVEGMSSFANLSARTGIEIDKLTKTARALATVDPAQGFKGAGIALKEFFSGEVTSLARRFEIPREALNGVEKITDTKQKFEELQRVLEQYGISQELVNAQAGTTAVAFDKLSGAAADAKAAIGQALASFLAPAASKLANDLNVTADAINNVVTKGDQMKGFSTKIFDQTASKGFDAFKAKIDETNAALDSSAGVFSGYIGHLQELTPAQYAYAQSLIATGSSTEEALAKVTQLQGVSDLLANTLGNNANAARFSAESISLYGESALAVAGSSAEGKQFVEELTSAVLAGDISIQQATFQLQMYQAGLAAAAAQSQVAAQATQEVLTATDLFTAELTANALEQANAKVQGDALKFTQDQLQAAALAAAQGMGATQQSAQILAGQFGITAAAAYQLISALSQLEVAKAKQALGVQAGGANEREDRLGTNEQIIARAKEAELAKKIADVQRANAIAAASAAEKVGLEKDALARLNKGTVEYEQQLGKVAAAERELAAEQERKRKKNSGAPKLTPNEKINTKLLDDQDKFDNKMEDAEQKHWDKMADIYAKFNEEQQKQFAKNEVSKRRSRADFYAGLQDAPAGVDTQKFAAQYEEAFAKAQEIAQSGKAKLAQDFLELRQKQIEEMKQLDEEAAKINTDRKEGKISKKDADAQLAYLEGRKKLIEDAQAEEQKLLLNNGDDNVNKLHEQLSQEEQAYNDNVDKVATAAQRKADAVIAHANRSKISVSSENELLATQEAHYRNIAQLQNGKVPPVTTSSNTPTTAGDTTDKPVDIAATNPIPVTTADALIVRQAELFLVHDADVMTSIGDMAARLEGKLGEVVQAVNSAKESISGAVSSVEGAIGRIKIGSPSVVGN